MAISFYFILSLNDIFRIIIGGSWILFQFTGIYQDYTNFERHRTGILEVGFLGSLLGGWHTNARSTYNVNCLWAIGGIFANFIFYLVLSAYFDSAYYNVTSEVPIIMLWVVSCALNFYAGMRAIPPRKKDIYKKVCRNAVYKYLKQNRGNAFSINALKNRATELGLKSAGREYYKDNIKEILVSLRASEQIESTVQNEEVYYLIP